MNTSQDVFLQFIGKIDLTLLRAGRAIRSFEIQNLPPIIHAAGTNGKGSTLAFLRAILEASGKVCHGYFSPHLISIYDKYLISGAQISEEELLKYAKEILALEPNLTRFEAETLAAILAFSKLPADYVLLETGMGGQNDITNILPEKRQIILTPIDLDHREFLGNSIEDIAREKCGIMRKNTPVIVGRQNDVVLNIIENEANNIGASTYILGRDFDAYMSYGRFCFQTNDEFFELPCPSLYGAHQLDNAAVAIMSAHLLGIGVDAIEKGIANTKWPARLQRISTGTFGDMLAQNDCELWLDGGHNPQGAMMAANFIADLQKRDPRKLILICGLLANKDINGFFAAFRGLNPFVICVPISFNQNGESPMKLANIANENGLTAIHVASITNAIVEATQSKNARILICGSLYLAGEVLQINQN